MLDVFSAKKRNKEDKGNARDSETCGISETKL